jgi:hypothetical protein
LVASYIPKRAAGSKISTGAIAEIKPLVSEGYDLFWTLVLNPNSLNGTGDKYKNSVPPASCSP